MIDLQLFLIALTAFLEWAYEATASGSGWQALVDAYGGDRCRAAWARLRARFTICALLLLTVWAGTP